MYTHKDNNNIKKPNILEYEGIVCYFQDYYAYRKNLDPSFSYQSWAKESGGKSRSHIRLVSLGKRKFTDDFIKEYARFNSFTEKETEHFFMIAYKNKFQSEKVKEIFKNKVLEQHDLNHETIEISDYENFMGDQLNVLVQVVAGFKDIEVTENALCRLTNAAKSRIRSVIRTLHKLNFIECYDTQSSEKAWKATRRPLKVKDMKKSGILSKFHLNNLIEVRNQVLEPKIDSHCRMILMSLDPKDHSNLRTDLDEFFQKIKSKYASDNLKGRYMYQFNLQAFPRTDVYGDEDRK